jgi:hypothetical protein
VFPEFSRSRLQSWTEAGRVLLNGAPAKVRQAVPLSARIELTPDLLPEQLAFTPEPVPLRIVYEDDALVVIDKPAGLVVHPAAGNWSGTILNGLLHRYPDAAGLPRAGIVHRLDKETSGLMVVARTLEAQTDLVRQLQARTVKRRYVALVWGAMPEEGIIAIRASARAWPSLPGPRASARVRGFASSIERSGINRPSAPSIATWRRGARIRFVSTAPTPGIRCWATRSTAMRAGVARARRCRAVSQDKRCMRGDSVSCIRARGARCAGAPICPRI